MELLVYVLHGTWYKQDTDVAEVLGVSGDIAPLPEGLCRIADTKARDCVEMSGQLQEERGDGGYEAVDGGWRYAKLHIPEHQIAVPEMAEGGDWKGRPEEGWHVGDAAPMCSRKGTSGCGRNTRTTARNVMRTCIPLSAWNCGSRITKETCGPKHPWERGGRR